MSRSRPSYTTNGRVHYTCTNSSNINIYTGNLKELCTVEEDKPDNRFNEAKCDRTGRLWCGTRGLEDPPGVFRDKQATLYSYDGGNYIVHSINMRLG